MPDEQAAIVIHERALLRKFADDEKTVLNEVVVIVNGKITERWKKGDDRPPPED